MVLIYSLIPLLIPITFFYYIYVVINMFGTKELPVNNIIAWLPLGLFFKYIYTEIKEELK